MTEGIHPPDEMIWQVTLRKGSIGDFTGAALFLMFTGSPLEQEDLSLPYEEAVFHPGSALIHGQNKYETSPT